MSPPDFGSRVFAGWRAAAPAWDAYTRHAFVEGMRTGQLPRPAFLHYLVQDYVFLVHFSRAWAMGVVKAESLAEMRTAAATVDALVNHEMRLHVEVCAKAGITEAALYSAAEEPENLAYTRYVMDAGLSGDFLDLMAALAPCVLGYGEIGARLGREATSDVYADWIGTYAGEEYQGVCAEVGGLIDAAAAARLGAEPERSPRWDRLCRRFATATRLEVGFWDMGLRGGA
ncbi:thiaminase II [Limibaculum sp. M0105]|uniref:Aminopyrimidine aminohydrolase n=1 Tax=Thermohalobaculum xanthum TaxID=2753746 RepID=A0A8J7M9R6_9RHOB|nr:thiaminase II [Thermohalobaculum xanthum]MBK0400323.1 thiaminase II [Thermohalobaculum xanthum]